MKPSSINVGQIRILPNPVEEQEITTFPFQIDYTGEADLEAYLQSEENEANGVICATFRGRPLFGEKVKLPQNFNTVTATTELRPTGQTLVNVTGTIKSLLSYEYDREPSKYTRLQKAMARCESNDWQKDDFLPELVSDSIALDFIKSLKFPELYANQDAEASSDEATTYFWIESMAQKGLKRDQEAKENIQIVEVEQ